MKKKLKNTKLGGFLKKNGTGILKGVADLFPGGRTLFGLAQGLLSKGFKSLDRNKDGRITLDDFKPAELIGLVAGGIIMAFLIDKDLITKETIEFIFRLFGF